MSDRRTMGTAPRDRTPVLRDEAIERLRNLLLRWGAWRPDYAPEYAEETANYLYYDGEVDLDEIIDVVLAVPEADD